MKPRAALMVVLAGALAVAVAVLILAACGDDDDTEPEPGGNGETGAAAIIVDSPVAGDTVASPVTISGTASVFEGTVQIRILGAAGEEIARDFTTATAGAPERGDFSTEVEFSVDEEQDGVIEVFEENVADEGPEVLHSVEVAVTLEP